MLSRRRKIVTMFIRPTIELPDVVSKGRVFNSIIYLISFFVTQTLIRSQTYSHFGWNMCVLLYLLLKSSENAIVISLQ